MFLPALSARAELAAVNRVPFVSTVSLERTVTSGTAPKCKFYVTDFENKEYMKNDTSETFVVKMYLSGSTGLFHTGTYAAGEHEVTLPTLTLPVATVEEERRIGIQATDTQGGNRICWFSGFELSIRAIWPYPGARLLPRRRPRCSRTLESTTMGPIRHRPRPG